MAGDLRLHEKVLIRSAEGAEAFSQADEPLGGGVTHQYGQRVIITALPPDLGESALQSTGIAAFTEAPESVPESTLNGLTEEEAMGLAAFQLRQSTLYKGQKANRKLNNEPWDSGKATAPDGGGVHLDSEMELAANAEAPSPTSSRLTGSIAVGIIIVEGPTAALKFSADERTKVVAEVQNGLSWLGSQSSPAGITWVYDVRVVSLSVKPGADSDSADQKEARWRDPAMAQLGYGAGLAGVQSYIEKLRSTKGTNWSYCGFFTKYPTYHFAYASIGGPRIVMQYDNDGWGPDNIDRVFAHETGHVFGAPDEYKASGCSCGGQWGVFNVPNANCETCAPNGGVPCIMKSNSWEMCDYTPYHLGFPQGQRYSGVFRAGSEQSGLWVNADWEHFTAKWQEWSNQGLRLEDLEVSQPGGQLRFSGSFRKGSGAYGLWGNADWNGFIAKWQQWSGQGLRLIDMEVATVNNQQRYFGVFGPGTGAYGLWGNADWNGFIAKWQEWNGQGLRLIGLSIAQVNNQTRYWGVFGPGTGAYGLWANADWTNFNAKWKEWSGQGLRLIDLEITGQGNNTRYSGVFGPGTDAYGLWVNADWTSFLAKWQEWSAQGLRLTEFDIAVTGIEGAASPVFDGSLALANDTDSSTVGFGFLAESTAKTTDEASGVGMGSVSFDDTTSKKSQSSDSIGSGSASFGDAGQQADDKPAGMGALVLDGKAGNEDNSQQPDGIGTGSSFSGEAAHNGHDGYEKSDAGMGHAILAG